MSLPSLSLEGKMAIVTGSRRGIGKAIALAFAEAGADVAVCDLVVEGGELAAVAEEIRKLGRRSLAIQTDVTRKADVDNLVKRVMDEFGVIDILVNSAGISGGPPLIGQSEEDWDKIIDVDLKGCYLCSQAVGKGMVERRSGNIISMASAAGIRGFDSRNAYNIAKAGVIMLTKVLARDLGQYNIRVNAIAPTMVNTEMIQHWGTEALAREARRIPLGRLAEVSDIVGPALFLASDASSYVSGDTIIVDGAQLA
ncbi:SDR family NAD(P)-dependent oxidoreductase [Chloroflexota bacterium]